MQRDGMRKAVNLATTALVLAAGLFSGVQAAIEAEIMVTKQQVQDFCGTSNVKLVFVNKPYLYYVDFSAATPTIVEVTGSDNAILPSISPDGQWIVYCKGPSTDGNGGTPSSTYICQFSASPTHVLVQANAAYEPRFVQNPPGGGMEVIYSTQGGVDLWNGVGQLRKKDVTGGVVSATEQTVWAGGGYVGGISWDNRYVCTALQWARMLDLQNTGAGPARLFDSVQFYNPLTGQDSITWDQCCNASISTSRVSTNMMMHLDFSFAGWAIPYVNNCQVYGQHDIVFITRYDDVVMRHYVEPGLNDLLGNTDTCLDVPASNKPYPVIRETQFDDPEWSNHPYYAAANLYVRRRWCRDSTGYRPPGNDLNEWKHEVVYLLDLKDSIYLPVVRAVDYSPARTVEMQWPYVWIEVPSGFQEDTSWLAQPRIPNAVREPAPALRPQGMRLELQDARLVSGTPLRSVRVYTVLGTLVEERTARAGARAVTLSRRAPGIYFVQAIDRDGQRTTLRWTVPR